MSDLLDLPPRLAKIVEDFHLTVGREKLELLLEYSDNLPPLPDWLREKPAELETVPECMTPVSVAAELNNGGMFFYFTVPAESPTVRGYASILAEGLRGVSPDEVLRLPSDFYLQMGLQQVLSTQRMNGMAGMVAHVKRLALRKIHP
jgi:cysteine desulfuration protein SufE